LAEKVALADAHAQYATALYKYRPSDTELSEKNLKKAYELDPSNRQAKNLMVDMYFWDTVPE
jgi:hypothetical protein